eukprot:2107582-Pleurochrysis_carterae.AAC.1
MTERSNPSSTHQTIPRSRGVKAVARERVRRRKVRGCTRCPSLPWPPQSIAPSAPLPFPGRSRRDRHPPVQVERNLRRGGTSATGSLSPCTPQAGSLCDRRMDAAHRCRSAGTRHPSQHR